MYVMPRVNSDTEGLSLRALIVKATVAGYDDVISITEYTRIGRLSLAIVDATVAIYYYIVGVNPYTASLAARYSIASHSRIGDIYC